MVFDHTGALSRVTRHDYFPFGEEIGAGTGGRTTSQGYSQYDGVRMKYTGAEHEAETGLDFMQARYYSSPQGRFTSPDDFLNDTNAVDPASWNLYGYVRNNPQRYTDPTGEKIYVGDVKGDDRDELLRRANYTYGCEGCVTVDGDGYLAVDTAGLSQDVLNATQFLTEAIKTNSWYAVVQVTNNNPDVAFGDSGAGRASVQLPGAKYRTSAVRIRLDFGDDRWVSGDSRAREAFLYTTFAHEVAHFFPKHLTDPTDEPSQRGPVVDRINEILQARGLTLRGRYLGSTRGGHWAEVWYGVAERDRNNNIIRDNGGIKVRLNETGNVIRWLKRNVGGTGVN